IRSACEAMLDGKEADGLRKQSKSQIRAAIQAFIRADDALRPISSTQSLTEIRNRSVRNSRIVKTLLVLLIVAVAASVLAAILRAFIPGPLVALLTIPLPVALLLA